MSDWQADKRWSDQFLPEIKQIVGLYLIDEAPLEEDREHNTDLIVLRMAAVRIACRIRRDKYLPIENYRNEFTIRAGRPSGVKTELAKIVEGWGDYIFYAFGNDGEGALAAWLLGDLNVFRLWFNRQLVGNKGQLPCEMKVNPDNSSKLAAFTIDALPPDFVVARKAGPPSR